MERSERSMTKKSRRVYDVRWVSEHRRNNTNNFMGIRCGVGT